MSDLPHLRHLLQAGLQAEDYGISFYRNLSVRATDDKVKTLCAHLAGEEARHKALIEHTLRHWLPLPMDMETELLMDEELTALGVFQEPPGEDAGVMELLHWALDQEERMVSFYRKYADLFDEVWKKEELELMVKEEEDHVRMIKALLEKGE
jgi:rubrerythrin